MLDLTPLITSLIAVICAVITVFIIPWIRAKTTNEQRKTFLSYVETAVKYCEQVYDPKETLAKKTMAVYLIKAKYGIDFDGEEIDTAIEAAVLNLHQQLEA